MQNVFISGRLGRDAELRNAGGNPVCSFTVAVDYRDGREKKTNWWRVSLWGKRGETLAQYLTKGTIVSVTGAFVLGEYDGKPQLNINASDVALLGGNGGQSEHRQPARQQTSQTGNGGWGGPPLDDDIPF